MTETKTQCECVNPKTGTCHAHIDADNLAVLRVKRTKGPNAGTTLAVCVACYHFGNDEPLAALVSQEELMTRKGMYSPKYIDQVGATFDKLAGNSAEYDALLAAGKEEHDFREMLLDKLEKGHDEGAFAALMSMSLGIPVREVMRIYAEYTADPVKFMGGLGPLTDPFAALDAILLGDDDDDDAIGVKPVSVH
jgi:hypothetical protein